MAGLDPPNRSMSQSRRRLVPPVGAGLPANSAVLRQEGYRRARPARRIAAHLAPVLLLTVASLAVWAGGVYQRPQDFIREAFHGDPPPPKVLWITRALRGPIQEILGHAPDSRRVRYWARDGRSVWILEEIGKEQPITTGIVVQGGHIERIKVLVFRESRGWEVRHGFFTDQFRAAGLTDTLRLDRPIDGISGATLSVRALIRLARLALFLDQQTEAER